jgi:hypothetical protein
MRQALGKVESNLKARGAGKPQPAYAAVAAEFGIPASSLIRAWKSAQSVGIDKYELPIRGSPTMLTKEQETALETWATQRADQDCCVHVLALRQKAQQLSNSTDLPTASWVRLFLERSTVLSKRMGEMVSEERRRSFTSSKL